jgi:two-component system chemotaxis response regulator CheB
MGTSVLHDILNRSGALPARLAVDGEPIEPGTVLVAPADHHLRVGDGVVSLDKGPRENGHRPAVDPLFRSVAEIYGPAGAGIVLSGSRDDGTAGLSAIKRAGGRAFAQDPATSPYPSMPRSAIKHVAVDGVGPVAALAEMVTRLANAEPLTREGSPVGHSGESPLHAEPGPPPGGGMHIACPDCGGVMTEFMDGNLSRFKCHTGHQYSAESLVDPHFDRVEEALYKSVRSLQERAALLERLSHRLTLSGLGITNESVRAQIEDCLANADVVRDAASSIRSLTEQRPA